MNEIEKKNRMKEGKIQNLTDKNIDLCKFFELATSNKIYFNNVNLHEIKNEILQDYTGDFELSGLMNIGPIEHKTNIRFKNMDDFESYKNAIDVDYDNEVITFTGYFYKLNTTQCKFVKGNAYGKVSNYMQEIVEYHRRNCYILTSGHCFISCINYYTKKDYTEEF